MHNQVTEVTLCKANHQCSQTKLMFAHDNYFSKTEATN